MLLSLCFSSYFFSFFFITRCFFFFFFFSSRRRHTRFDCDWSSDVCSSDLAKLLAIYGDLRLCRGLAVDTRLDLDVEALAAGAEQGDEQDGKKTQVSCGHEESLGNGAGSKGHDGCVRSHRGRLDIDLAGIDDLVLVGGGTFDRLPLGLLDLRQFKLDLLAEEGSDLDRLCLRLVADAARLHPVAASPRSRDSLLALISKLWIRVRHKPWRRECP